MALAVPLYWGEDPASTIAVFKQMYPDEMTHVTCALPAEPFSHNEAVACAISGA